MPSWSKLSETPWKIVVCTRRILASHALAEGYQESTGGRTVLGGGMDF